MVYDNGRAGAKASALRCALCMLVAFALRRYKVGRRQLRGTTQPAHSPVRRTISSRASIVPAGTVARSLARLTPKPLKRGSFAVCAI
jgi:hypothetical protein